MEIELHLHASAVNATMIVNTVKTNGILERTLTDSTQKRKSIKLEI